MPSFTPTDVYDRFLFNTREQVAGEPIDVFVDSLRTLSRGCKYEGASEDHLSLLVRDRFVIGIRDKDVQYELLQHESSDLSLEDAVRVAKEKEVEAEDSKPELSCGFEGIDDGDDPAEDDDLPPSGEEELEEEEKKLPNGHNNEKRPVRCDECDATLCNVYKLRQHVFRRHRRIFNCKVCEELQGSSKPQQLRKHVESAHGVETSAATCLICKKSYSDKYALKCHMKRLHGDLLGKDGGGRVCRVCDEPVADLRLHMETRHDDTGMKCKVCSKQLRPDESLRSHFVQMHSKAGKTVCQYCGGSFANIDAHVATLHMTEKPHKCDKCEYSHATKVGLKNHKLYFHPKGNAHMCHACPYKSHHKSNLKQHIQVVHEKEKPFQCPQCDKCFFHKGAMTDHVNVMHLKKLFECKWCGKTFTNRSGYNSHQRAVHKGIWHHCGRCDGRFQDKGDLKRHVRNVHDKNYLFRCDHCGRGFPYRAPMREHMLKHHGVKMDEEVGGDEETPPLSSGHGDDSVVSTPQDQVQQRRLQSPTPLPMPPSTHPALPLLPPHHPGGSSLH